MNKGSLLYKSIVFMIISFSWCPLYSSSCCGSNDCQVCSTCEYCEYCNDDEGKCSVCNEKNESSIIDDIIDFLMGCFKVSLYPLLTVLYLPLVKFYFSIKLKKPLREMDSGLQIVKRSTGLTFLMILWGYTMMYLWIKNMF
jgi:hypothetical protein